MSPPAWWCGLKSYLLIILYAQKGVTTCVVVWIEITRRMVRQDHGSVTTCVVVWIEIRKGPRRRWRR